MWGAYKTIKYQLLQMEIKDCQSTKKKVIFNVKYIRNSKDYVVTKSEWKNESKFIDVTMKAIHHLQVDHIPA